MATERHTAEDSLSVLGSRCTGCPIQQEQKGTPTLRVTLGHPRGGCPGRDGAGHVCFGGRRAGPSQARPHSWVLLAGVTDTSSREQLVCGESGRRHQGERGTKICSRRIKTKIERCFNWAQRENPPRVPSGMRCVSWGRHQAVWATPLCPRPARLNASGGGELTPSPCPRPRPAPRAPGSRSQ